MQLAATIAVVLSVLLLAFQARALAAQSRVANEVAGTQAHREIVFHFNAVISAVLHPAPGTVRLLLRRNDSYAEHQR